MKELVDAVKIEFTKLIELGILAEQVNKILKDVNYPWQFLDITDKLGDYLLIGRKEMPEIDNIEINPFIIIHGPVYILQNAEIGPFAHIKGPVIIGPGCKVHDCYVRPGTILFGNNHEGKASEVKNSVILRGSNVPHQNYVGDSVIGAGCNLGAGTKIANLKFDESEIAIR